MDRLDCWFIFFCYCGRGYTGDRIIGKEYLDYLYLWIVFICGMTPKAFMMGNPAELERKCSTDLPSEGTPENQIYYARSLTLQVIDWWNVYVHVYVPVFLYAFSGLLVAKIVNDLALQNIDFTAWLTAIYYKVLSVTDTVPVTDAMLCALVAVIIFMYLRQRKSSIFIVDFATFTPPESWKVINVKLLSCSMDMNKSLWFRLCF